jgi:hypothetical protein
LGQINPIGKKEEEIEMPKTVLALLGLVLLLSCLAGAQCPVTAKIVASDNFPMHGQKITFTATATSPCGTPSGTFTFYLTERSLTNLGTKTASSGTAAVTKSLKPWRPYVTEYAYAIFHDSTGMFADATAYPSAPLYWDWDVDLCALYD